MLKEVIDGKVLVFQVGKKEVKYELDDVFEINENAVTEEMMRQASLYAFFSQQYAEVSLAVDRAEFQKDKEYAMADLAVRKDYEEEGKRTTEGLVEAEALTDNYYQDAVEEHSVMQYKLNVMRNIVKALEMKAEMLISIGAQLRQERSMTGMRIKEYEKNIEDMKEQVSTS